MALRLDRPTRRLIQHGLRNAGFDPGPADGLFGPTTRAAIRAWQASRDHAETGYLDRAQADALRTATTPTAALTGVATGGTVQESAAVEAISPPDADLPSEAGITPGQTATATQASRSNQLPPEILVDRQLVRVERLLAEDDPRGAHDVINGILALQREHRLALPADFHFRHAQVAFAAGLEETSVTAVNKYLLTAGQDGQ
ncbi:MAG: peptidoglycan-binding domain-containing protein, partial [Gemmatimonadetes bacterium]|nr:peptidoglycan-binding domain-containing protein [Gemmatimonadota bacterium]